MVKVINRDGAAREDAAPLPSGSLMDEIVRKGARRMLAAALEAEGAAYVGQFADERAEAAAGWWCVTVAPNHGR